MDNIEIIDYNNINMYVVFNSEDYRCIEDFSFGYAATYHKNGICGYIDTNGYETLLYDYNSVGDFCNLVAPVCRKNNSVELWGFINREFEEVVDCKYIFMQRYKNYFIVKKYNNEEFFVIDSYGKTVYEDTDKEKCVKYIEHQKAIFIESKSSIIKKTHNIPFLPKNEYIYENEDGEKIIPYQNTENRDFHDGYVIIKLCNDNYKIFDEKGKQLKVHSCIKLNAETMYLKNKIDKFNLRITSTVYDGFSSLIKLGIYEYILFGKTEDDLLVSKSEFFEYIEEEKQKIKYKN